MKFVFAAITSVLSISAVSAFSTGKTSRAFLLQKNSDQRQQVMALERVDFKLFAEDEDDSVRGVLVFSLC